MRGLLLFRLAFMVSMFAVIAFVLYYPPSPSWITRIVDFILQHTGNGYGAQFVDPVLVLSYLFGFYMFSFLFIGLQYFFLVKRKVIGFWISFALDFLTTLATTRIPLMALTVLVLGTTKTARAFFNGMSNEQAPLHILDEDVIL